MGRKSRRKKERRAGLFEEKPAKPKIKKEVVCLKTIQWGTYLILATPLVVLSRFFFPFISPKSFYFMGLTEVIFACWLILIIFAPRYRPRLNRLLLAISLFLLILILATIFGVDPSRSFWANFERMAGLLMYLHLFAFFLVTSSVFKKKNDWIKIFTISTIVASVVSIIALTAKMVGEGNMPINVARNGATLGNSSFLAAYLLFNLFFGLYLFFEGKKRNRPYIVSLLVIIVAALFTSGGRAASLSSILGIALLFLLYLAFKSKSKKLKVLGRAAFILSITGLLVGIVILNLPGSFLQQKLIEHSNKARPLAWQMAIFGLKDRPLLGWGPENFELLFDKYFHPCFFLKECGGEPWFDRAHNIVFDTLAASGFLGLFSYLFMYFCAFYVLWKKYLKEKKDFWIVSIISCLLISYFVQNLTVFDSPSSLVMLFLVFGFVATISYQPKEEPKIKKTNFWQLLFILIILFCFSISFQKFVIQPAKSSYFLIESIIAPTPEKRIDFYQKALQSSSLGKYQLRAHMGDLVITLIQDKKASEGEVEYITSELEKSIKESPRDFRSYLILGKLYLLYAIQFDESKLAEAERVITRGIEISPTNQQGYWVLAQIEALKGDCKKALSLAEKSIQLEPRVKISTSIAEQLAEACKESLK
jgi:O-antigen ligase